MHPEAQETFRVGFVLFVALLVLVIAVLLIGSETLATRDRVPYHAYFDDVGGLSQGASVYLRGVDAGRVESVHLSREENPPGSIRVILSLDREYQQLVYKDCEVQIETEGLLGDKLVSVRGGTAEAGVVEPNGVLPSRPQPFLTGMAVKGEMVVTETGQLIKVFTKVVDAVENGQGTLSRLIKEPTIHDNLTQLLIDADELVRETQSTGVDVREAIRNLERILDEFTRRFGDRSDEVMIKLQNSVEQASRRIQSASEEFEALTIELREGKGTLPRLIQEPDLFAQLEVAMGDVRTAAEQLANILTRVARGEGTVGGVIRDRALLTSIEDIVNGVRQSGLLVNVIGRAERKGRRLRIQAQTAVEASQESQDPTEPTEGPR